MQNKSGKKEVLNLHVNDGSNNVNTCNGVLLVSGFTKFSKQNYVAPENVHVI